MSLHLWSVRGFTIVLFLATFLVFYSTQAAHASANSVAFSHGDVIVGLSGDHVNKNGFSINIENYVVDLSRTAYVIGDTWNTYLAIFPDGRLKVRAEDKDGNQIFNKDPFRAGELQSGDILDINWHVDSSGSNSYITINGETKTLSSNYGTTTYKIPKFINTAHKRYHWHSGNFEVSSIEYLDGSGNILFYEDGAASDWNQKLHAGEVEDVAPTSLTFILDEGNDFASSTILVQEVFDLSTYHDAIITGSLNSGDLSDVIAIDLPSSMSQVNEIEIFAYSTTTSGTTTIYAHVDSSTLGDEGVIEVVPYVSNNPCKYQYCAGNIFLKVFAPEGLSGPVGWEVRMRELTVEEWENV